MAKAPESQGHQNQSGAAYPPQRLDKDRSTDLVTVPGSIPILSRTLTGALAQYAEELSAKISRQKAEYESTDSSALIFRLGQEYFALPTRSIREVIQAPKTHSLPGVRNPCILGLANFRGELVPCVSLGRMLGIESSQTGGNLLLVLAWNASLLACPVDEVLGPRRFRKDDLRPSPRGMHSAKGLLLGILEVEQKVASVLSADAIFSMPNAPSAARR